jgi:dTDP-4-dehydrorhamnose reductase
MGLERYLMDTFDHVVVLGAGGMLGRRIVARLDERGALYRAYARSDLDITDARTLRRLVAEPHPSLIINCAAYTRVDDCETHIEQAMAVNGAAVGELADLARELDVQLVHISSDYVFAGDGGRPYREDDPTAPPESLSAYGRSKLEGDARILASGCRHLIARTSWVYGPGGSNFVDTIIKAAATRPELKVVDDQRGRPTYTVDLAAGIMALLDRGASGIVNVTNSDECTWFDFAREIAAALELKTPIHPCTSAEFPRPAKRPAYSVLDVSRYAQLTGAPLRSWREAVRAYLAHRAPSLGVGD